MRDGEAMTQPAWPSDLALWCGAHLRLVAEIVAQYEGADLTAPVMRDQLQRRLEDARALCQRAPEHSARFAGPKPQVRPAAMNDNVAAELRCGS